MEGDATRRDVRHARNGSPSRPAYRSQDDDPAGPPSIQEAEGSGAGTTTGISRPPNGRSTCSKPGRQAGIQFVFTDP